MLDWCKVNDVKTLGAVIASRQRDGEPLFPRTWNEEYIDAPLIRRQRQPSTDCEGATAILAAATGQYRVLYALLAGCGPLRAGEALGLEIRKHISEDCRTLPPENLEISERTRLIPAS